MAMYDSISPMRTMLSLNLHSNEADQNRVVFDHLFLENTYDLVSVIDEKPYQVHFHGPVDHIKAW
jgi:hypothetical protein